MAAEHNPATDESEPASAAASELGKVVDSFVEQIDGLARSIPLIMAVSQVAEREANQKVGAFLDAHGKEVGTDEKTGVTEYAIGPENVQALRPLIKRRDEARTARRIIPRTFQIALVSQFDAFLGSLLRALYLQRTELLSGSDKSISFSQLTGFGSLEEAREYFVEKEIESVIRDSHSGQFKWLENKFGLPLTKDLASWPFFIETTERRNLFVHTNGSVSSQYLKVCKEHQVRFGEKPLAECPKVGDELGVSSAYFRKSYHTIYEIGVKLAHVLWRKVLPSERAKADSNLLALGFELLVFKEYELAQLIHDFAVNTLKQHSSEGMRLRFVVNQAQSYKWGGDAARAAHILDAIDWSACSDDFQLGVAVLREKWSIAAQVMARLGPSGKLRKEDYRDWPVFQDFRKRPEFLEAFAAVFGEPFAELVVGDAEGETERGDG